MAKTKSDPSRRVGIYCRISDDRDGSEAGVERQETLCREFVKTKKWSLVQVYTDNDISASKGKVRPAHKQLLEDLTSGYINTIVVWQIDRLYRRPIELESLLELMKTHPNIHVVATAGHDLRLDTSDGQTMARVLVALAKRETDMLSQRITAKHLELAKAGLPHGGARSFGYDKGHMTINKEEAKIIKKMVKLFLATKSSSAVVRWLHEENIKTAQGNLWSRKTVTDIMSNPRIAGFRSHHGVLTKASWPAIISQDEWEEVKTILSDPNRKTMESTARKWLMVGIVYCGNCGHRMTAMTRGRKLDSTGSYACRKDPALLMSGCGSVRMFSKWIDDFVTESALYRLKSDKSFLKGLTKNKNSKENKEQSELLKQMNITNLKLGEIQDWWLQEVYSKSEYERARKILVAKQETIQRQLERIEASKPAGIMLGALDLDKAWEERNLAEKQALLKLVIEKVLIHKSLSPGRNTFDSRRIEILWRE
jgi:DNA invertase Pin-like site-specific DNA recombinase